ncbi:MAG: phage tail tube protein [Burkholderiaceae bacterium]|jgi:hypothetical protein|nr:phage tail tube protein [Burkholderiaceae bacterium]
MATGGKLLGRAYLRVNGVTFASIAGTATLNPGGVERTPVSGDYGYLGYTEKPVNGEIQFDIAIGADTNIDEINRATDVSITFEADTGQVWVMRNGTLGEPAKPAVGDNGKATLRYIGKPTEQV